MIHAFSRSARFAQQGTDSTTSTARPGLRARLANAIAPIVRESRRRLAASSNDMSRAIESLEMRRLLSTSSGNFNLAEKDVFYPTTTDLLDTKSGPMTVAGETLANMYVDYRRAVKNGNDFVPVGIEKFAMMPDSSHVTVDVGTRGDFATFIKRMKAAGMSITASDATLGVVEGIIPIDALLATSTRSDVALLSAVYKPTLHTAGIANNQGDRVMNTDDIRSTYPNVTGAGITVGVLSDSYIGSARFNSSVRTGDLPNNVNVLNDNDGTDEGRAMLEEIHDIAPGAGLAFSTANGGQLTFANHIRALQSEAGASVITDDIGYVTEPFFGPGVVDQAISDVVSTGASYTSAAANSADSGFQQAAQYTSVNNRRFIDFDPSAAVATRMQVKIDNGGFAALQWDNPYNGVTGKVTADMDIRVYDTGTNNLISEAIDNNFATGVPIEAVGLPAGYYDIEIELASVAGTNPPPTFYRLAGDVGLSFTKYATTRNTTAGHNAGPSTISVGAVDYIDGPPYKSGEIPTAFFSSQGPTTQVFDAAGNRLAKALTLQKPDIAGVDGINTSFFGSDDATDTDVLPNFYGTSAAAPNVAAGIALIKAVTPTASQATILGILKSTARPVNGTAKGKYDSRGGFGLVDFNAALPLTIGTFKASFSGVTSPRQDPVTSIKIKFSEQVRGFDAGDLSLQRNGGPELLTATQTLTTSNNYIFTLHNLDVVTTNTGVYTLTLKTTGAGIKNLLGKALTRDASYSFTIYTPGDPPARPIHFSPEVIGSNSINLTWEDRSNNEDGFQILRSVNSNFTNSTVIKVGPNVQQYLDQDLAASETYYYRIRASNSFNGNSGYTAPINATTGVRGDVVVDNSSSSTRITGSWSTVSGGSGVIGGTYLSDGNSGKGTKSVKYVPSLAGDATYYIYATWTRTSSNATNVPFDIYYGPNASLKTRVLVNERDRGGNGWVQIGGPYLMNAGEGASVIIRNAGTTGTVLADAIRFLPSAPLTTSRLGTSSSSLTSAFSSSSLIGSKNKHGDEDLI